MFGVGIYFYFSAPYEPAWSLPLFVTTALLVCWYLARHTFIIRAAVSALLAIALGFLAAKGRVEAVSAPVLSAPLRAAKVQGWLERIENRHDQTRRLTLKVVSIAGLKPDETPARVRITQRKSDTKLQPGQAVRVTARLSAPPTPALPNGYDFARAAYFERLGAVGYVINGPILIELSGSPPWQTVVATALETMRRWIGDRIEGALSGEVGAMANALMTGERSGISDATNELYRDAGIFHILSISGLHMAIMGGSVFLAIRFILAAFPTIALRFPIKKWAAAIASVATFAYLLISGAAHPAVRSFLMIVIVFLAILIDRPAIALRNVAIAALCILVILPESLFNAGFQLSFAAVVGLVSAYEWHRMRTERRRRLGIVHYRLTGAALRLYNFWLYKAATVATTVIAGLATAPFAAFHFHTSQQYSVLTNVLAIPVSNILVMPAALAAFIAMPFGLETYPLQIMGYGIQIMTWAAGLVTDLPGAVTAIPAFPDVALQLMIGGGLWLTIWQRHWRWLGVAAIIAGIYVARLPQRPAALIGVEGRLVAVRDVNGQLTALKTHGANYEYSRWLAADGDTRQPNEAWRSKTGPQAFKCDLQGCIAAIGTKRLALPRSAAALDDDCRYAEILVLTFPNPTGCQSRALVIDVHTLREHGTHAIYVDSKGDMRIETVEAMRGSRPWTKAHQITRKRPLEPASPVHKPNVAGSRT